MASLTLEVQQLETPDPVLTSKIVTYLKSQGVFDQFRRECMADVDTKPAYQNLRHRVEGSVKTFLQKNPWTPEMNKNQLRDKLRKHIHSGGFLDMGVDRIVDQVVNPKIYSSFLPKVEEVVQLCLKLDDNDKPMFVAPPPVEEPPQPLCFKDRHNLAPRAKVPAPLTGPRLPIIPNIEALKPPEPLDDKETPGTPELDTSSDKNYTADDNDVEDHVDDEDNDEDVEEEEESPPFEPHSENDRLILGIRTDSSDESSDIQVVTTVVDDDLEDRIDKEDKMVTENDDIKEEDDEEEESSSDEYVPKTPTLNMESSDGTVIEFNSITEYRQYQSKFVEDNFSNVEEEVVCSQWMDESKEERSSNEEDSVVGSRKRKLDSNSFDEASNSSVDKGSTSDEGRTSDVKKLKLGYEHESEVEKESTSDEERSNSFSSKKLQPTEYERETEKGISSDEEKGVRSSYYHDKKMHIEDEHESEMEKGNTSDEGKSFRSHYLSESKLKREKNGHGSETEKGNSSDEGKSNKSSDFSHYELGANKSEETGSGFLAVNPYNEDSNCSNSEQSFGVVEPKSGHDVSDIQEKRKSSSSSSKDSEKSHRHNHHGHKESSSHHRRSKDKVDDEENKELSVPIHSSHDKDRHESSKDRHKDREGKKSESSSRSRSKHHDKNRDKSDTNGNGKDLVENDVRHKLHKDKSKDHDKEKKKHDSQDRKKDHESTHGHDKDTKYSSKHDLSSSKHSHKSSNERHKSDKEHKHKESSDKHRSHDKKSEKDNKQGSKKKHRDRCKTSKDSESRRSSDRDSNGPSGRGHTSSSSKSSPSKSNVETCVESGERTSSNSDNTVSDNVEVLYNGDSCKFNASSTLRTNSRDYQLVEGSMVGPDSFSSDQKESNDNVDDSCITDKQWSAVGFERKDARNSGSDKTGDYNRECSDKSEARRKIDETELVEFEGVHNDKTDPTKKNTLLDCKKITLDCHDETLTENFHNSARSAHDNSSEKENIELSLDNTEPSSDNLSSPESEGNVRFKKPKIAANIFEVKKIMLARRKMKQMEKRRMKLVTNTTVQLLSNTCEGESQEEFFGFGETLSDKKERYNLLIQRLAGEIENEEVAIVNTNLITDWIDLSPDLDDYIENILKGKVHRQTRVRIPPISDEHYRYDPELNAYILLPLSREEKFDGNLNNLEPSFENNDILCDSLEVQANTLNGSNSKLRSESSTFSPLLNSDFEILSKTEDDLPKTKKQNVPQLSSNTINKQEDEMETGEVSALVSTNSINTNPVINKTKPVFSVTYNQYYKDILKEKNKASVRAKTAHTVVKITNDTLSEQVVVKTIQPTPRQYQVPRITKSEPKVNGQISTSNPKQNQMAFISRVNKSKNTKALSSSTTKSSPVNGNVSPDFTIKFEGDIPMKMSPELINKMIGIQVGDADQGPPLQKQQESQQQTRESRGAALRQQRYDSTDLYKPRPQLTSRRSRSCHSSAGCEAGVTVAETRRKRPAPASKAVPTKQRR